MTHEEHEKIILETVRERIQNCMEDIMTAKTPKVRDWYRAHLLGYAGALMVADIIPMAEYIEVANFVDKTGG